ncbi:FAD-dependent oxidoreductase [Anthocerotibacter panamensis]|uniref:FAD-dependent oxidoreductase n=1 Tax=Anthocerotibacter panamensis TaxID=2857077 RepID=UPI001C408911|nr:FAD-dependent oxidoreductase [Anthocerotibacter panamensis]
MPKELVTTDVLVVGAGTAGVAAALQCARRGVRTLLVDEGYGLGGMLTQAGVCALDGNELVTFQTGLWRAFLQALYQRQSGGLNHGWVSFFTFDPRVGAAIFSDWVQALAPTLAWLPGQRLEAVLRTGERIHGAVFSDYHIEAQVVIEATELGDVLALGAVPWRWGWETQADFQEPSAPVICTDFHRRYPVQALTWVALTRYPKASLGKSTVPPLFSETFKHHTPERMLTYGALPGDLYMLNWPIAGNDYAHDLDRLIAQQTARDQVHQEARDHTRQFLADLQAVFGPELTPATDIFPEGLALVPYYRESRRVVGRQTVTERDILPLPGSVAARLDPQTIAFGNYANDHHYPGDAWPVQGKALRWGGRWTGTPFTIPYGALLPKAVDGLLVTEKNISVSHIANGATRLQPLVLNLGQAAGMAAALSVELACSPQQVPTAHIQEALLQDPQAPAGVVPFYDLAPHDARYRAYQQAILRGEREYHGFAGIVTANHTTLPLAQKFRGVLTVTGPESYFLEMPGLGIVPLVTLQPAVAHCLASAPARSTVDVEGIFYPLGAWLLALTIQF